MTLPISPLFKRKWFARSYSNGEAVDATMLASLDGEDADLVEGHNQVRARLNAISTSAGSLRYALVSMNVVVATASQTAFTVTTYDSTAGASFVLAWSGTTFIPTTSITQTSTTVVTLPAQAVSTSVTIAIFGAGNGTSQLASTSSGQGASLIGINDAGGYLTATEVETALQEIAGNLASASYLGGVLTLTGYLQKAGGTMSGAIAMGANKITGLAAGTAASNDAARMADITAAALTTTLSAYLGANYLATTGGTMSGVIAMGSQKITGLASGSAAAEAVNYGQLQTTDGAWITTGTVAVARLPVMTAASGAADGTAGIVPKPVIGDQLKVLYGDATWKTPPAATGMTGATASVDGTAGYAPKPVAGDNTKVLFGNGTWGLPIGAIGSGYILIRDEKAFGSYGGTGTATAWTARDINTEVFDTGNHCSIAANQFTLLAGTYRLRGRAPFGDVTTSALRLRNISDGTTTLNGDTRVNNTPSAIDCFIEGVFTITASKTFELQYYIGANVLNSGLGDRHNAAAMGNNVYATVEMWRE